MHHPTAKSFSSRGCIHFFWHALLTALVIQISGHGGEATKVVDIDIGQYGSIDMDADRCDSRVLNDSQFIVTENLKGTSKMATGWYVIISLTQPTPLI